MTRTTSNVCPPRRALALSVWLILTLIVSACHANDGGNGSTASSTNSSSTPVSETTVSPADAAAEAFQPDDLDHALKTELGHVLVKTVAQTSLREYMAKRCSLRTLDAKDAASVLGVASFTPPFVHAVALEALVNVDPFVLALFELDNESDVAGFAREVWTHADQRKWVCVSAERKYVAMKGQRVLLIMGKTNQVDELARAFAFTPLPASQETSSAPSATQP